MGADPAGGWGASALQLKVLLITGRRRPRLSGSGPPVEGCRPRSAGGGAEVKRSQQIFRRRVEKKKKALLLCPPTPAFPLTLHPVHPPPTLTALAAPPPHSSLIRAQGLAAPHLTPGHLGHPPHIQPLWILGGSQGALLRLHAKGRPPAAFACQSCVGGAAGSETSVGKGAFHTFLRRPY